MFARVVALATAASLFALAAAAPGGLSSDSQCNGGEIHCCNETQDVKHLNDGTKAMMGLLDLDVSNLNGMVGFNCSPLNVAAIGGNSCTAQKVCCEDNKFNGLVAVGCAPINVAL